LRNLFLLSAALILLTAVPLRGEEGGTIRLLTSGADGLVFEYFSGEAEIVELPEGKEQAGFQLIRLPGCDLSTKEGEPMLPSRAVNIGLPPTGKVSFSILEEDVVELTDIDVAPGPQIFRRNEGGNSFYQTIYRPHALLYGTDAFFPSETCAAEPVSFLRHQRILSLILSPVQFNPLTKMVRIHRRIVVQVQFGSFPPSLEQEARGDLFENIYRSALLNYHQARKWRIRPRTQAKEVSWEDDPFSTSSDWFKISLRSEGLCRLTPAALEQAGLDLSIVDPATIKIYNLGHKILPRQVGDPPIMKEIDIIVAGQDDGSLDSEDEILFYATALSGWEEMSQGGVDEYANPYTDVNVYWLTYGGPAGKRMEAQSGAPQSATYIQAEGFKTTVHQERDFLNQSYTGLTWYWTSIAQHWAETVEYQVTLRGVMEESCQLKARVEGVSYPEITSIPHHVYFYLNDSSTPAIERLWYGALSIVAEGEAHGLQEGENILKVVLPREESEWDHILFDWFEIQYWRGYQTVDDQLHFSSPEVSGTVQYDLGDFSQDQIFLMDVSDPYGPIRITEGSILLQDDGYILRFQDDIAVAEQKRYYAANPQAYIEPLSISRRIPANLRQGGADLVMVVPETFRGNLEPLATMHREEGLRVAVANLEDVYDQFAWGLEDPTAIRDYLWFLYHQGDPPVPSYVLLFGDGNFDYKNNSGAGGDNWIPPFETGDICTDDWFVRLDGDYLADMMIGRLPVRSRDEADVVVEKIVDYVKAPLFGPWRNRVMIVSDDETAERGEGNELFHTRDSEDLARNYIPPSFDQHKIYLMEYPMNWSNKKPEAQQAVIDGFNEGMLVINWIGHGNFDVWAHEDAFRSSNDIPKLANGSRLPLVYAASCDVGRFDHTLNESMAEELLRARDKGAVASIAGTRYCYATPNAELNKEVLRRLLGEENLTLGEGLFGAKLSRPNSYSNDQKYALFGDPCMRLGKPEREGRIVSMSRDTLMALDQLSIHGQVLSQSTLDSTFQGTVFWRAFDSARPTTYITEVGSQVNYLLPGATLFRGPAPIESGFFQTTFVVPKDISYGGRMARIRAYLEGQLTDGLAYRDSLTVQGTVTTVADTTGPTIELEIAGQNFASGDFVSPQPTLLAHLEDENGINITGQVGHWIVLTVDGDAQRINVTDKFNYDPGSYQRGTVDYTLGDLIEGEHTVTMKAWDNFNNFSTATITFEVVGEGQLIRGNEVLNYPNPFDPDSEDTQFYYELGRPARVTIKIYTVAGRLIRTLPEEEVMQGHNASHVWNGEDQDGDQVANGVYLYKLVAHAEGKRAETYGKVVVMR
jgi:hypothetical protein